MKEKKRIFAVIDTNVLVSSFSSRDGDSKPAQVIKAVLDGIITPVYNYDIISEYKDVLNRSKFKFDSSQVKDIINVFLTFGIESEGSRINADEFTDKDDVIFFEITMSVEGAYLVTGNIKHFPETPDVVTPARMIEILRSDGVL